MAEQDHNKRIAEFFFEIGTMRKLPRIHRQTILTEDVSDTIATHSYRVAMIGWMLAKEEDIDAQKVVMMCLVHDLAEIRSNDHNWLHKRYIKIFEDEIAQDQLGTLPYEDFKEILDEYEKRETKEAIVAKEADRLDQILLLREYEWQGNKEAKLWLYGDNGDEPYKQLESLRLESTKRLAKAIYDTVPSSWWHGLETDKNR